MENKKTLKVILITLTIYMLLSWFIVSGYFSDGKFTSTGFNQFGLLDFLLAPFSLFNYYVVSMTKRIDFNDISFYIYRNILWSIK